MWKEVLNIDVSIQKEEWKEYVNRRKNKNFQMIAVGGVVVLPTARDFLEMFMSDITQNVNEYSNFEFDHLVETGIHEMSLYERNNWFGKAEALLLNDFPVIPLYHGTTRHLVSPKIRGWKDNFMDVHPSRYLYIVRDKEVH
jgi:oligopeptide transport system substrate-binding protein